MFCINCGHEIRPDVAFCPYCGAGQAETAPATLPNDNAARMSRSPKKANKKKTAVLLSITAVTLVAALLIGYFTQWFGLAKTPYTVITKALLKTLESKSVSVSFNYSEDEDYSVKGEGDCSFDLEQEQLKFDMDFQVEDIESYRFSTVSDGRKTAVLYDFSDGHRYGKRISIEPYLKLVHGIYNTVKTGDIQDFDWKTALDELEPGLYEDFHNAIDIEALNKAITDLSKKMKQTKWLKENFDYSCIPEGNESTDQVVDSHIFCPVNKHTLQDIISDYRDVFLDEDLYNDLIQSEELENIDTFSISICDGVIVSVELSYLEEKNYSTDSRWMQVCLYNHGKSTLDTVKIEKILSLLEKNS